MKIDIFSRRVLHNREHLQFGSALSTIVDKATPLKLGIVDLWKNYLKLLVEEEEVMALASKNANTTLILQADNERDELVYGLGLMINALAHHYLDEMRLAGNRVKVTFDICGDIARLPYDEESAAINTLCNDLTKNHASDLATLNLEGWVAEAQTRNNNFVSLVSARLTEEAAKTLVRMKGLRAEMDNIYQQIVERINAMITINGDEVYIEFVKELNMLINHYRDLVALRKGRNEADDTTPTPENPA